MCGADEIAPNLTQYVLLNRLVQADVAQDRREESFFPRKIGKLQKPIFKQDWFRPIATVQAKFVGDVREFQLFGIPLSLF